VTGYSMRLPKKSTFNEARAAALAELPIDGKVLWTATRRTCAQMELQSSILGQSLPKSIGTSGMVFVEVVTETASGDEGYNPNNANELIFLLGDYAEKGGRSELLVLH